MLMHNLLINEASTSFLTTYIHRRLTRDTIFIHLHDALVVMVINRAVFKNLINALDYRRRISVCFSTYHHLFYMHYFILGRTFFGSRLKFLNAGDESNFCHITNLNSISIDSDVPHTPLILLFSRVLTC